MLHHRPFPSPLPNQERFQAGTVFSFILELVVVLFLIVTLLPRTLVLCFVSTGCLFLLQLLTLLPAPHFLSTTVS